ncbi:MULTISPECIES: extracellular solute-binding protein [unclassified Thalassospira]|jgi:microcin C transport system substrate-binding protein|uniref:extracellular solute-binding protein n=1 Tax=unclassified Thalassospira TaxID=2648997 RepID=UPI00260076A5|nr:MULTISPECIES: extracellular solute-binding protein [unclassified Thalassospira]|tara:strand:+ start:275 stop:2227 length:1953 start_codon:yes stop_codon:yes gene_type:complete
MISYAASMKMPGRGRLGAAMTSILFASAFTLLAAVLPSAGIHAQEDSKPNINPAPTVAVDETDLAPLTTRSHGISLYGDLKYGPDFHHFDYVNPDAPKGGKLLQSSIVAFDTLNPFTLKGNAAAGIGLIYDSLMVSSADEPSSMYGLIAREIELPQDRSFAIFHLDPRAKFQDGSDITAEDVKFSYEILLEKGSPVYRQVFSQIEGAEIIDELTVKFTFKPGNNRETPLTVAGISIMPKKFWDGKDFAKTTFEIPVGSGAYKVASIEAGRRITYERDPNYWAANLPVNRGQNNFDTIQYDTYLDPEVQRQAFLAGEYMIRSEHSSRDWNTAYNTPAVERGDIQKEFMPDNLPVGMQAYVMNNRLPIFSDQRVRRALQYGFDFQWLNRAMFYGAYSRTDSFFVNSELAATGIPTGDELALLEPYRDQLPARLFTEPYTLPDFDAPNGRREALREAMTLLNEAGWEVRDKVLVNKETGQPFRFELIIRQPGLEKIALVVKSRLKQLGVEMDIRLIDTGQWVNRIQAFDFEVTTFWWQQSLTPGNEQRVFWSSEAADQPGSRNFAGIKNPVVDAMIENITSANSWEELVAATRALDRVLLWGDYVIPQYYLGGDRMVWWNIFGRPDEVPLQGMSVMRWWIDPDKAAKLQMGMN